MKRKCLLFPMALMVLLSGCGSTPSTSDKPNAAAADTPAASSLKVVTFKSQALDKEMKLSVYLPKGYTTTKKYPVLYMLHAFAGNESNWMPNLALNEKADQLIDQGKIKPIIIIAPQFDNSYGLNTAEKAEVLKPTDPKNSWYEGKYEDYLYRDVVQYTDQQYSTINARTGRYIGGQSMGGFASLYLAFKHPDLFSKVGAHSPAIFQQTGAPKFLYPNDETRKPRDPLILARELDLTSLDIYLDSGDKDPYRNGTEELSQILQSRKLKSQYHLNTGEHNAEYWKKYTESYLLFYAGT